MTVAFGLVILIICLYGGHRYWLLWMFVRRAGIRRNPVPPGRFDELPTVTVQLPMYNEKAVAERAIEAACRLDYPRDKLRIQVLDDSTDESAEIARRCCERMRAEGYMVEYIHRSHREGYKAGALAAGLAGDDSEFVAVFDSDFVPPRDFLRSAIHQFTDPRVGVVQAEWSHLNRGESLLTECQAMFLDGHFVIEQCARAANDRWFNFNGTAGLWRRACIDNAGGWHHDTLTEDADLSYRAQIRGWKFVYLPELKCPAELPPTVGAFLTQQHRWNKGMIQTTIKLWPEILRSDASWKVKLEAWFHLTSPIVYVAMVVLLLLALPAFVILPLTAGLSFGAATLVGSFMLFFGTIAAGAFYVAAQKALGYRVWESILYLPILFAIGIGLSVINTKAVLEALFGVRSPFVRTPKFNTQRESEADPASTRRSRWLRLAPRGSIELCFAAIAITCFVMSFSQPFSLIGAPFLLLFAFGYLAIGVPCVAQAIAHRRTRTGA